MPLKPKAFVDSNVVIAGLGSFRGASHEVLRLGQQKKVRLLISRYALGEIEKVLQKKLPHLAPIFLSLLKAKPFHLVKDPPEAKVKIAAKMLRDPEDAPLLAAAIETEANYFLTLDKRHFLQNQAVLQIPKLRVLSPAEFLGIFRGAGGTING